MPRRPQPLRIAIDTGGTFTDCVWIDPVTGRLRMLKVFSTPADPSQAIVEALRQISREDRAHRRPHPPPRHHRRHQHAARTQRRPHRPRHHRRIRRRHRNRTPGPPQALRLLLRPHRAAGPQRSPLRHQRTHRQRRRNPDVADSRRIARPRESTAKPRSRNPSRSRSSSPSPIQRTKKPSPKR